MKAATDRPKIENPFTSSELEEMFENQKNKIPFELHKDVKASSGECIELKIHSMHTNYLDIWKDDYIVSFHYNNRSSTYGFGFAKNRFDDFDEFKKEIFSIFLIEEIQLSLF